MKGFSIILVVASMAGMGHSGLFSGLSNLFNQIMKFPATIKIGDAPVIIPENIRNAIISGGTLLSRDVTLQNFLGQLWYNVAEGECRGAGPVTGTNGTFIGNVEFPPGTYTFNVSEFGGPVVCRVSCNGECKPYRTENGDGPVSLYPFNCQCNKDSAKGCGQGGPVGTTAGNVLYVFHIVCKLDTNTCPCRNMDQNDPTGANYQGHVCTWQEVNLQNPKTGKSIASITYDPILSPIRWCSCCPK